MTVTEYFTQWLEDQKIDFQKSTYESCTVYFNKHIIPWFEAHANIFSDLSAKDIKDYVRHIKTAGRLDGKAGGLSEASVKKHLSLIKQALNSAVVDGYIHSNPSLSVRLKRSKKPYSDKVVMLTTEEAFSLLEFFKGHRLYPLIVVALFYGLRRSEVIGLRWSSVDFIRNELRIEHTIVKSLTVEEKDSTKTPGSNAVFELLPNVKEILLDLFYKRVKGCDYVFSWEDGRPFRPDYVTRAFQKHLKKCNLPVMRFHDLRHSTASILFDKGMSLEEVKIWLRHSDIETTSNIYLHYGRARKKIVSDKVSEVFNFNLTS